jgi:hypothetical protein
MSTTLIGAPHWSSVLTCVWYVCGPHDSSDLLHGLEVWTEAAVAAEDLLVHDGRDRQTVEAVRERLPQLDVESSLAWTEREMRLVTRDERIKQIGKIKLEISAFQPVKPSATIIITALKGLYLGRLIHARQYRLAMIRPNRIRKCPSTSYELTLVVEPVDSVNTGALVVSAEEEEVLRVLDLVREQEADGLERLLAAVHVVAQEEVVRLGREAAVLEQAQQVRVLTVDVA